ncbi:MAG: hypothetical protein JXA78_08895, partial [Anaerolineales bacterium]|nr:hypothetical protein [Anaerolineales bacterium]
MNQSRTSSTNPGRRWVQSVVWLLIILSLSLITYNVVAEDFPTVNTDKEDYAPEETATITGAGFTPGAFYDIPVIRPDNSIVLGDGSFAPGFDTVQADDNGAFTYIYQLNGVLGLYEVRVYPESWNITGTLDINHPVFAEAPVAMTTFTDGALDWTQCRNDSNNDGVQEDCEWTTGSLGSNNSIYTEGDVVPHRKFRLVDAAGPHFVTIDHSFYDSSKDAYTYDFFATPDATLESFLAACNDIPTGGAWAPFFKGAAGLVNCQALVTGKSEIAIPTESSYAGYTYPFVAGAEADAAADGVTRNLWISCGAFVDETFQTGVCEDISIEILGHSASNGALLPEQEGPPSVDDFVQMKVSYNTTRPDTMVAIWVGAHLAKEFYWDNVSDPAFQAKGAATAAGASFHVRLTDWDEDSAIGNRDNQMQTGAVVPPAIKEGYKWHDLNADGIWDAGEPGLSGWKIYIDYNDNGQHDLLDMYGNPYEPYDITSDGDDQLSDGTVKPLGFYQIRLIEDGAWKVREAPPVGETGWICSFPTTDCYHQEQFKAGNIYPDNNFGNYKNATKSGYKYEDINKNGRRDEGEGEGEPGLNGWTICVNDDTNCTTTANDSSGNPGYYEFNLKPGHYIVYEDCDQPGWVQTEPVPTAGCGTGVYDITLSSGENHPDNNFGNYLQTARLTIIKNSIPDDPQDFTFQILGPSLDETFYLDDANPDDGDGNTNTKVYEDLSPGAYSVAETVPPDWYLIGATCDNEDDPASITLGYNDDITCIFTNNNPDITLTKDGDPKSKVGDPVNYTITVENTSPEGTPDLYCTITDAMLSVNESVTLAWDAPPYVINAEYTVPEGAPDELVNTAYVECTYIPPLDTFGIVASDDDSHTVDLFWPSVEVIKDGTTLSKVGDLVTYSFTINNTSSSDSPPLVNGTIVDNLLGDLLDPANPYVNSNTCSTTLLVGETCTITAERVVLDTDPDPLKNTVTVHYNPEGYPNDITDWDDHSVNLFQPAIELTKSGDALSKAGDDVAFTITLE